MFHLTSIISTHHASFLDALHICLWTAHIYVTIDRVPCSFRGSTKNCYHVKNISKTIQIISSAAVYPSIDSNLVSRMYSTRSTGSHQGRPKAVLPGVDFCPGCDCDDCISIKKFNRCENCLCDRCNFIFLSERDDVSTVSTQKTGTYLTPQKTRIQRTTASTHSKEASEQAMMKATDCNFPQGTARFCIVTLSFRAADKVQICHIVPRALDDDLVSITKLSQC